MNNGEQKLFNPAGQQQYPGGYQALHADSAVPLFLPPNVTVQPPIMLQGLIRDRPAFGHVEVQLSQGQQVKSDAKAMIWMDDIPIKTECGSCGSAIARKCSGEHCCMNIYTGEGKVTFGTDLPGDVLPFGVMPGADGGWIVQAGAFLAGTTNLDVSARFAGCCACICNVTKPFLTKVTIKEGVNEPGMFWAASYGAINKHDLPPGKTMYIDAGLLFAANVKASLDVGCPGGCLTWCYGREGFCLKIDGPGLVYTQNRDTFIWQRVLHPPEPKKKDKKSASGALIGA